MNAATITIVPFDGEFYVYVGQKLIGIRASIGAARELAVAW